MTVPIASPGADTLPVVLLLAHGAGAPVTSAWMEKMTAALGEAGIGVVRFNFAYMAARAETGVRKPPPRAETLVAEYEFAVAETGARLGKGQQLLIGGKSMGGRVASLAADALYREEKIAALVCLGYPFHPPDKPEALRTAHLATLACPALIVQGERDPFGGRDEVPGYDLAPTVSVVWAADGDHDLSPRRSSGATLADNMALTAGAIARFAAGLPHTR